MTCSCGIHCRDLGADGGCRYVVLSKTLKLVFVMHLNRGRHGHSYQHNVVDAAGKVVGQRTKFSKGDKATLAWFLGDREFNAGMDFMAAYEQQLRDEEWDAAAKEKIA